MKKRLTFIISVAIIVCSMAMPVLAVSLSCYSKSMTTQYQGSSLCDKGTATYQVCSIQSPKVKVGLQGRNGIVRGYRTINYWCSGTYTSSSYWVEHAYGNYNVVVALC